MTDDLYKSLFKKCYSIMLIIHPETGRIIDANAAACRYYGYKMNELKKMHVYDLNMLTKEQTLKEMEDAKTESRNYFNFKHKLANGEIKDVEVFSGPIIIGQKKVLYSIIHDITARKQIEKQVQVERQFSESLINSLPGVMYVFDQYGRFIKWNKNFETVTGYSSNQIKEMNPLDFISLEDKGAVRETIEKVFHEGRGNIEAGFSTMGGETIPYLFTGYRFVQKNLNYLVGIGLDISDRVKVENEKEHLINKLQDTLSQVKQLSGFLPICASCKKIRDDKGYWNQIESYIKEHSEAEFSHGICPDCSRQLYPDIKLNRSNSKKNKSESD